MKKLPILFVLVSLIIACGNDPIESESITEGSITFKIDGQDDYVISNCTFEIDTITAANGLYIEMYRISATDHFENEVSISGETADYQIPIHIRYVSVNNSQVPTYKVDSSPLSHAILSDDAPFFFNFVSYENAIVSEDDDQITMEVNPVMDGINTFGKITGGVKEELDATVRIQMIK